ncbi:hypothetical protein [Aquabacterium sp. CECT 9606]|uniref:hypothetical protein n=1 Tax=Aquabacterium sp. CECT 9606 TaxID=2845822 RepID=UPI001E409475|nr:hypothetical protein [Aquabacterium sp. CECT 9606]CAH0355859.1 hypothetical protein AQB9606_04460 [Aquabacterium sp. CECT 9606]
MTNAETFTCRVALLGALLASPCFGTPSFAQSANADAATAEPAADKDARIAMKRVNDAVDIVRTLRSDAKLDRLLPASGYRRARNPGRPSSC